MGRGLNIRSRTPMKLIVIYKRCVYRVIFNKQQLLYPQIFKQLLLQLKFRRKFNKIAELVIASNIFITNVTVKN